jgi:hypothetical protein
MDNELKLCPRCGETKSVEEFRPDRSRKDGRFSWCRPCHAAWRREWRRSKKGEEYAERQRARKRTQEQSERLALNRSDRALLKRYGSSLDHYAELLDSQHGRCAICDKPESKLRRLCMDHDHETSRLRGLLCHNCNMGLGRFMDSPTLLQRAIDYLTPAVA